MANVEMAMAGSKGIIPGASRSVAYYSGHELVFLATKYLMRSLKGLRRTEIEDIYVGRPREDGTDRPRIKYRLIKNENTCQALMVVKEPSRYDVERFGVTTVALTDLEYRLMTAGLNETQCPRVAKNRYRIEHLLGSSLKLNQEARAYAYVYKGDLKGLVTVNFKNLTERKFEEVLDSTSLLLGRCCNLVEGAALAGRTYRELTSYLEGDLHYRKLPPWSRLAD